MNALWEKCKALDKKIWIGIGVGVLAVIAVVVTLVLVLGGGDETPVGDPTNGDAASTTTSSSTTVSTSGASKSTTKKGTTTVTTTSASTTTTAAETGVTNAPTPDDTQSGNVNTTAPTQPTAVNPSGEEILGAGSKDQPYLETPDGDTMVVTTVSIPAGKSVYYSIYRVGGMVLTIDNPSAYVVHEGTKYTANGGSVSVQVADALASDALLFEIGNSGSSQTTFTLRFLNQAGSYMNPVVVTNITANNSVSLPEGHESGYYYKYNAEKTGVLRLYMTASADSVLLATNNRNSAQRTTEDDALTDAQGKTYIELEVQAGDEIIVNVGAKPNRRGKYPATEITWNGQYA